MADRKNASYGSGGGGGRGGMPVLKPADPTLEYNYAKQGDSPVFIGPKFWLSPLKILVPDPKIFYSISVLRCEQSGRDWSYESNQEFFRGLIENSRPVILLNTLSGGPLNTLSGGPHNDQLSLEQDKQARRRRDRVTALSVTVDEIFWLVDNGYALVQQSNGFIVALPPLNAPKPPIIENYHAMDASSDVQMQERVDRIKKYVDQLKICPIILPSYPFKSRTELFSKVKKFYDQANSLGLIIHPEKDKCDTLLLNLFAIIDSSQKFIIEMQKQLKLAQQQLAKYGSQKELQEYVTSIEQNLNDAKYALKSWHSELVTPCQIGDLESAALRVHDEIEALKYRSLAQCFRMDFKSEGNFSSLQRAKELEEQASKISQEVSKRPLIIMT